MFDHILPHARAWKLSANKNLRKFFNALTVDLPVFFDRVWLDIFPSTTDALGQWEYQFSTLGYPASSQQQRRERLDAIWKAVGGQDPTYIQKTLRENGFDVYVHEWWDPLTLPAVDNHSQATARNPLLHLAANGAKTLSLVDCGESAALCGEAAILCGAFTAVTGYGLVNIAYENGVIKRYPIPTNPQLWPYFLYIGGATFGQVATVEASREQEFEQLCLKICPAQQWLGILVEYV